MPLLPFYWYSSSYTLLGKICFFLGMRMQRLQKKQQPTATTFDRICVCVCINPDQKSVTCCLNGLYRQLANEKQIFLYDKKSFLDFVCAFCRSFVTSNNPTTCIFPNLIASCDLFERSFFFTSFMIFFVFWLCLILLVFGKCINYICARSFRSHVVCTALQMTAIIKFTTINVTIIIKVKTGIHAQGYTVINSLVI